MKHFFQFWYTLNLLPELGLCPLVPNKNVETEFWVKEKWVALTALPGKGGHSRPKDCALLWERISLYLGREKLIAFESQNRATDKDQGRCKLACSLKLVLSYRIGSGIPCSHQTVVMFFVEWRRLHQVVSIFHVLGVLVLWKNSKILFRIFLEEEPGPCSKAIFSWLLLVSASPPFPDQQLFEPILGTQGRSWTLTEVYCLQTRNGGHRKAFVSRSPTGPGSVSKPLWR